jgi:hypothetical protein
MTRNGPFPAPGKEKIFVPGQTKGRRKGGKAMARIICAHCGQEVSYENVSEHFDSHHHLGEPYIRVYNGFASLNRPYKLSEFTVGSEWADPQPPQRMLRKAVRQAGGAMTISGSYPINEEVMAWLIEKNPEWRR